MHPLREPLAHVRRALPAQGPGVAFVLGTGISGLSIGELLSRNGWRVTLIDTQAWIGGDASLSTQNWFHTGWLYAALPYDSAMRGCFRALKLYAHIYGHLLPTDVLNVNAGDDGVSYPLSDRGWFNPSRILYLYATSAYDLNGWQRLSWKPYLSAMPLRRLRRLGYPVQRMRTLQPKLSHLLDRWEGTSDGASRYWAIPSTDARLETRRVLQTLTGLLSDRTSVVTGMEPELVEASGKSQVVINGDRHTPDLVVLASGRSLPMQLRRLSRGDQADRIKSIRSPIVLLKRALDYPNFIRFTPNLPHTLNHIRYALPGLGEISTVGSYDYYPLDVTPDTDRFADRMCRRLGISTSEVAGSYCGTKTEYTGALERRYNHAIAHVNANTCFAIAGKFSQFPLLVQDFADAIGLRVDVEPSTIGHVSLDRVGLSVPERMIRDRREPSVLEPPPNAVRTQTPRRS